MNNKYENVCVKTKKDELSIIASPPLPMYVQAGSHNSRNFSKND